MLTQRGMKSGTGRAVLAETGNTYPHRLSLAESLDTAATRGQTNGP